MGLRCLGRDIMNGSDKRSRKGAERKSLIGRGRSYIAPEQYTTQQTLVQEADNSDSQWENLPLELLFDIIRRVETCETSWPARRDVVSCAAACRLWRATTKWIVKAPEECGLLTFPMSLKQPGPREVPIQCFIKRDRASSTYRLYLGLSPALAGDASKFLLAAKKTRKAMKTKFLISLAVNEFSRSSNTYMGKVRSNFLGNRFHIYDGQPQFQRHIHSKHNSRPKFTLKKASSVALSDKNIVEATVSYELNVLRTRGPRRMRCTMNSVPLESVLKGGNQEPISDNDINPPDIPLRTREPLVLKNKIPRWHEQLQCWCLNFKGRVSVASVKNFQLMAAVDPSQNVQAAEHEEVILQFGKIGKDIFTMDYRYPLSAFQAFAICLSSFGAKPVCE